MDFSTFQAELRRIGGSVQAFAAIAAALRLHQAKKQADPPFKLGFSLRWRRRCRAG